MSIVNIVAALIDPVMAGLGFELYDLEFVKEGQNRILRLFIDKEAGITINDCETVSRAAEKLLDEADPIPYSYILEVSSPGIDRALKKDSHYDRYTGHKVDIKLFKAINSKKTFTGELTGLKDGIVSILDDDGNINSFEQKDIASCRLAVVF